MWLIKLFHAPPYTWELLVYTSGLYTEEIPCLLIPGADCVWLFDEKKMKWSCNKRAKNRTNAAADDFYVANQ